MQHRLPLALCGLILALAGAASAGRPAPQPPSPSSTAACSDSPTPSFTCAEQKAWGKCGESWMVDGGYCAATCGRCGTTSGSAPSAPPASPPATNTTTPTPIPTASLSGSVAEYGKVLSLSWLFYYAQRSGKLSAAARNPISWRSDSHLSDPAVGGFYDAGDHLKLNFPLATSLSFLAWGVLDFPEAYAATGQTSAALDNLRWGADYLMACHTAPNTYIAQIGDPGPDHAYWGRPEDQTGSRPAFTWDASKPASDAAGAAASALASASLLFKSSDPAYAARCLDHARGLFDFASKYEGKYSDSIPSVTYVYMSANFLDDLAYAAAWLYKATGDSTYLNAARAYLKRAQYQRNYFISWDSVFVAADNLLLSMGVGPSEGVDLQWQFNQFLQSWQKGQNGIKFSPKGLAVAPLGGWGNLRHASNAAFMMAVHAKYTTDAAVRASCLSFVKKQMDYALGLAGSDRSYVVGYGTNPPTHAHHRAASCPNAPAPCNYVKDFNSPGPNPHVLAGALVGGPSDTDKFVDARSDYPGYPPPHAAPYAYPPPQPAPYGYGAPPPGYPPQQPYALAPYGAQPYPPSGHAGMMAVGGAAAGAAAGYMYGHGAHGPHMGKVKHKGMKYKGGGFGRHKFGKRPKFKRGK